jgi:hypothetical protein
LLGLAYLEDLHELAPGPLLGSTLASANCACAFVCLIGWEVGRGNKRTLLWLIAVYERAIYQSGSLAAGGFLWFVSLTLDYNARAHSSNQSPCLIVNSCVRNETCPGHRRRSLFAHYVYAHRPIVALISHSSMLLIHPITYQHSALFSPFTLSPCMHNPDEICLYEPVTATLNGKAVYGVKVRAPSAAGGGFGTSAVLSVPSLKLDAKTMGNNGAQLCITLPNVSECGSVDRLIPDGVPQWNASLLSADNKCCPITTLNPPAPLKCETCWIWDVVPPTTTKTTWPAYNFLSRNSCPLASINPNEPDAVFKNCCEYEASYYSSYFTELRKKGLVTGFDRPICTATSVRLCGNFTSQAAGAGLVAELADYGDSLRTDLDNTDDTVCVKHRSVQACRRLILLLFKRRRAI